MTGDRSWMCEAALNLDDVHGLTAGEELVFFRLDKGVLGTGTFVRYDDERLYVLTAEGVEESHYFMDVGVVPTGWGTYNPLNIVVRERDRGLLPRVNPYATFYDHLPGRGIWDLGQP
jgi:hypothetical protein